MSRHLLQRPERRVLREAVLSQINNMQFEFVVYLHTEDFPAPCQLIMVLIKIEVMKMQLGGISLRNLCD